MSINVSDFQSNLNRENVFLIIHLLSKDVILISNPNQSVKLSYCKIVKKA